MDEPQYDRDDMLLDWAEARIMDDLRGPEARVLMYLLLSCQGPGPVERGISDICRDLNVHSNTVTRALTRL